MKKKVLSFFAMLAIFGLAFAAIPDDWTAPNFWHEHGKNLTTNPAYLSATAADVAETYAKIKASCEAYEALNDDQIDALYAKWDKNDESDEDFPLTLFRTEPKLKQTNAEVALTAVTTLAANINAIPADGAGITASSKTVYLGYLASLEAWETADVLADFDALKGEGIETLKGKIADGLLFVEAAEWVNKVNDYKTTFDKAEYETQKSVVEEYQTVGKALGKQTADVATALATIEYWLDQYAAQEILDGQNAAKDDFYAAFEVVAKKSFNDYELVQSDLAFDTEAPVAADNSKPETKTDFAYLARLKKALDTYKANRPEGWDITTDGGIEEVEIAYANRMLEEFADMQAAVEYLNDNTLYYDVTTPKKLAVTGYEVAKNDYAKIMQVKADLAESATTTGKKYIAQLFTTTKIDYLYTLAQAAFKAYDKSQFIAEAIAKFKEDYATILATDDPETEGVDESYKATAADYNATEGKKTTVRDAINEFKNDVKNWSVATTYRNVEKGGNVVSAETAWTIEDDTTTAIGQAVYDDLETSTYPTLQALVKSAAEKMVVADLLAQLNTIYTENYVDATAADYNEAAVIALKDAKAAKAGANTSATNIGYKTVAAKASTNTYATTNIQYWMWDADNNVIAECKTLTEANEIDAAATTAKHCWGYDLVVNKFRKSDEYTKTQKVALQAMSDAAVYLVKYESLIWPAGEITSDMATLATAGKKQYNTWNNGKETPVSKTDATLKYPTYAKILAYINPIVEQMLANYDEATDDVETITGQITLYQGTATKTALVNDPTIDQKGALCYTSKKALADTIAKVPNTIAYIEEVLDGDLPLNVVCLNSKTKDSKGNYTDWRATEIKLTYRQSFWFPIAINKVEYISMDRTFNNLNKKSAFLMPFDVNVGDCDANFKFSYLDMIEETEDENDPDKVTVKLNYKTKKEGEKLTAYLPYMITPTVQGTYTFYAENTSVGVTKNTLKNGLFVHPKVTAGAHVVDCSTTKTTYTMAGVTLAGARMPASTTTTKYYTLTANGWQFYTTDLTLPNSGTVTLQFTGGRNKEYIVRHRDVEENEAAGIDNMSTESKPVEGIYTINGQKVDNMNKSGLYIVNGKKVMVK